MKFIIVCELGVPALTWQQARVFEDALKQASAEVFPEERIKGLWVHRMPRAETYEEALATFRARWTHGPLDIEEAQQLMPERWQVQIQTAPGYSEAFRVFRPIDGGKWHSIYAHSLDEVWAFVEEYMPKPKRQPRRVRKRMTGRAYFTQHGIRLPAAYLCDVTCDRWETPFDLDPFRAHCMNPECENEITSKFVSPWCRDCAEVIGEEWRLWFWKAFHQGKGAKAFKKMQKVIFG